MIVNYAKVPFVYRCDVCGRQGYWKSDGFSWSRYGPVEGDGLDTCSDECRGAIPDAEAAFKKLFKIVRHDYLGPEPIRRHNGLIGDKPPRREPEDDDPYAPTESTTRTLACPKCDMPVEADDVELMQLQLGHRQVCRHCKAMLVVHAVITYTAAVASRR